MRQLLVGLAFVAHGWAHIWYVILSRNLLVIEEDVAWTGKSWILSRFLDAPLTSIASTIGYSASLIGFVAGGIGYAVGFNAWREIIYASAVVSSMVIVTYWDGNLSRLIDKGLIGLLINLVILVILR